MYNDSCGRTRSHLQLHTVWGVQEFHINCKETMQNKTRQNQEFYKQALMPTDVNSLGILLQISVNSIVLSGSACLFNKGPKGRSSILCTDFIYSSHGLGLRGQREGKNMNSSKVVHICLHLYIEQQHIFPSSNLIVRWHMQSIRVYVLWERG